MIVLATLSLASATDITYCVGGYAKCEKSGRPGKSWHHHNYVLRKDDPSQCFACFDELDSACEKVFLAQNLDYTGRTEACPDPSLPILKLMRGGLESTPPPLPKPVPKPDPVQYTPQIDRVSAGPYTAGDKVTVYASVPDGRGGQLPLKRGTVVLTAGGRTARYPALAGPSGALTVEVQLPADASSVTVAFEPEAPAFAPHESFSAPQSASRTLAVETCRFRVKVGRPGPGVSLAVGEPAALVPALFESDGRTPARASKHALKWTVVPAGSAPIEITSAADGSASWTPPADLAHQSVSIQVGGRADGFTACPVGEARVSVSDIGLGWDTSALPATCTVSRPCRGTATLTLPTSPGARARVEALLAEPTTRVELRGLGAPRSVSPSPDHTYAFDMLPERVENLGWRLAIVGARGEIEVPFHPVEVRPGLELALPEALDFGTFRAGTPWTEVCAPLDYSASTSLDGHGFSLAVDGLDGCDAEPVILYRNPWGQVDRASLVAGVKTGAHQMVRPVHDICLVTSGCAGEISPDGARLRVVPLDPEFADQAREVRLRWEVTGIDWFRCWGWMLVPVAAALAAAFVVYGWIKPFRFPAQAAIRVASKVGDLKRNAAIGLRDLPGSGSGWYRDARLGLHASGEIRRDTGGAVVILRARGQDVWLDPQVPLETRNRRSGAFEPTPGAQAAIAGAVYRAGPVYFKVEA